MADRDEMRRRREARSLARLRRAAAENEHEWPAVHFDAVRRVKGTDERNYRIRVVAPGDSVDHAGLAALAGYVGWFASKGTWVAGSRNSRFVVVLECQRGPFRGFNKLEQWTVGNPQEAAAMATDLRRRVACGEYSNRTGVGQRT